MTGMCAFRPAGVEVKWSFQKAPWTSRLAGGLKAKHGLLPQSSAHPKSLNPRNIANGKRSLKLAKTVALRVIERGLVRKICPNSVFEGHLPRAWRDAAHAEGGK